MMIYWSLSTRLREHAADWRSPLQSVFTVAMQARTPRKPIPYLEVTAVVASMARSKKVVRVH